MVNSEFKEELWSLTTSHDFDKFRSWVPRSELLNFIEFQYSGKRNEGVVDLFRMGVVSLRKLALKVENLVSIELYVFMNDIRYSFFDFKTFWILFLQLLVINHDIVEYAHSCMHDVTILLIKTFLNFLDRYSNWHCGEIHQPQ